MEPSGFRLEKGWKRVGKGGLEKGSELYLSFFLLPLMDVVGPSNDLPFSGKSVNQNLINKALTPLAYTPLAYRWSCNSLADLEG